MEEFLVESSTLFRLVPSLETMTKALKKNSTHHDHLIALVIVLMDEAGFRLDDGNTNQRPPTAGESITTTVDPDNWRSFPKSKSYELRFKNDRLTDLLDCKIVAITIGDVIIINLCPNGSNDSNVTKGRSVAFQTLKYVNPHSSDLAGRFMNLREFSHRFKDCLTTPIKGEILTNAGIANPSFRGLPTELKLRILGMLQTSDLSRISQTCREFRDLSRDLRRELRGFSRGC